MSQPTASAELRYPHLFTPISLGPVRLDHRVIIPGHSMVHGDSSGLITERYHAYLVRRARGGAALVGIESAPVHPDSLTWTGQLELWRDEIIDPLARTAEAVHDAGSRLSIILWHGGHNVPFGRGAVALAPSAIPSVQIGQVPKAISVDEIRDMVGYYAAAAERCARAGIDVIEVQTASDYLLGSFLSPQLNHRTDGYGGSVANRCRFVIEVLEAIRGRVAGKAAVGLRTSVFHAIPGDPDGYGLEESLAAMVTIAEAGVTDYVSVMSGSNANFAETISPMGYPRVQLAEQSAHFTEALSVPVTVAGRIRSPDEAEAIVANGQADIVAMARTFIADPDWVLKVRRGEEERIRPCMSCNQVCLGFATLALPAGCNINAAAGREFELARGAPAPSRKHIAVVGGGPAGLECARVAARRGYAVTLYEATGELGGALRLAALCPHREEMLPALQWWERELARLGVTVQLNTAIHDPGKLDADEVVWATGGSPGWTWLWRNRPRMTGGIPGAERLPHGRDILAGKQSVAGSVLVIDEEGNWPAVNLVEYLAAMDGVSRVTVTTASALFGDPELSLTGELPLVTRRLESAGVEIRSSTFVKEVRDDTAVTMDGEALGPFDSLVLSMGAVAKPAPDGVSAIGDCVAPRSIWAAVQDGARLALKL